MLPRQIEPHKTVRQQAPVMPMPQQSNPHQHSHIKPANHEQRHSQSSVKPPEFQQKKADFPNRSSSSHSQQPQPQQMTQQKKPNWPQQHPSNAPKPAQSHVQASQSQPNLNSSSSSMVNNRNSSQSLPSYNDSIKQHSTTQNDYWFNDKLQETTPKLTVSPPRQSKSMFSPSPEHDVFERNKLMMMGVKRNDSPKSDKVDRRSSTPSKREKRADLSTTPTSQKSQVDRKPTIVKVENSTASVPPLIADSQMKKRPFSAIDDTDFHRDSKSRKVEHTVKTEPTPHLNASMKQPIETNPDIVKSLLQECYTSSKFDSFGMDSPLDVIGTEPTSTPASSSYQAQVKLEDSLIPKTLENGFDEDHHKRSKSKKKKEKHKHKEKHMKKKKSHKSDREDRKDPSLKFTFKSDSKSSPESVHTPGGLKIKIPIKDVNKSDLNGGPPPMGLPPAPLKLKISKEKMGNFNNTVAPTLSDGGGSSSSSSHKKKDKDRSKSKSAKHGNNNNLEFKDAGYQHQQLSVNKVSCLC